MGAKFAPRWTVCIGPVAAIACGAPEQFLEIQTHELRGDDRIEVENACVVVRDDRGPFDVVVPPRALFEVAGPPTEMISVERLVQDLTLVITVIDAGSPSQTSFGDFFDGERTQRFNVSSILGRNYELMHRSTFDCDGMRLDLRPL